MKSPRRQAPERTQPIPPLRPGIPERQARDYARHGVVSLPRGRMSRADFLAGEEPLGIRVDGTALTMTMRTPGDDLELAAGFLVSEAVIGSPADIAEIKLCDGTACGHAGHIGMGNMADVRLARALPWRRAPGVTS
jgi:FdhD protein